MASKNKREKRSNRAKAKAKEARIIRNNVLKHDCVETLEISSKTTRLFERMNSAQTRSRIEMLTLLIQETLFLGSDDPVAAQRLFLVIYDAWKNGEDSQLPENWWCEAGFLSDYAQAAKNAGQPSLMEAWCDESQ